ncbi:toxin RelE [Bacteroidia bacterium]|nr:toxin RelE [Bacteroidia bacterium]
MRIIAKKILREFWTVHEDCEQALLEWFHQVSKATYESPIQVKQAFPSASILNNNRIVFNIKGNSYRLIVRANYDYQMLWVRFIGTHAEYDKVDANII